MLQYAIDDMIAHGGNQISLCTHLNNYKARAVYEGKFGFQPVEDEFIELVLYTDKNKENQSEVVAA